MAHLINHSSLEACLEAPCDALAPSITVDVDANNHCIGKRMWLGLSLEMRVVVVMWSANLFVRAH